MKERERGQSADSVHSLSDRELMRHFLKRPGFLLARVDQISTALFGDLCDCATLSQAEFILLLDRLGPMIQIELAKAAGVDKSTTAYVLDNLQDRGLIRRDVPEKDRRSLKVSLTQDGEALVPVVKQAFLNLQEELEEPLDPMEKPLLVAMLHRLGSYPGGAGPLWRTACDPQTGVLDNALSFLSRRVLQLLLAQFLATTREYGLTLRQFSLLFVLSQRESLTQAEFARMFGLDPATCGVIIRGALRRGLISGERCSQDKRARRYRLTEAGQNTLEVIHPLVDESEATVFARERAESREGLIRQLTKIVHAHSHRLRFPGAI